LNQSTKNEESKLQEGFREAVKGGKLSAGRCRSSLRSCAGEALGW